MSIIIDFIYNRRAFLSIQLRCNQVCSSLAESKEIGVITHYFGKISVAVIKLSESLNIGDKIRIVGSTTDFEQLIDSMEINKKSIEQAEPGEEIAIKVKKRVREHDIVYLIK
jgi:putative protease